MTTATSGAMRLSQRVATLGPSATLTAAARAKSLAAQGLRVFDFSVGEPDFTTPEPICAAARAAMAAGHTHYTPAAGIPELRQAIAQSYRRRASVAYAANQVVVSNGAKHAIHNVLTALCGPGDEVIIPAPYWVSYSELVKLSGAQPVIIPTPEENDFKLTPGRLRAALGPRSRLVMINSPCNPTGSVYSPAELMALADVVLEHDLAVLSDEIYEDLVYDAAEQRVFAGLRPELLDCTITVSGVSKSYAMTGWRIGWAVGPPAVIAAIASLQSQETSNPCSISQYAALAALEGDQSSVVAMRHQFARRRAIVLARVARLPGIHCRAPQGAFYAFLNVRAHFGRALGGQEIRNSVDFCTACLDQAHVVLVAGSAFGADGYARMSFATDEGTIHGGFDALERLLRNF